ncbi:chromosomal replication initiator protein DnaA [Patescibacteria group bacterium]|nr:chromosomal replication initiator protein DnaA [Patescibacteria group bacterium]
MSNKDLWQNILRRLKPTMKLPVFKTWFADTAVLRKEEKSIVIGLPTPFAKKWVSDRYRIKILQAAQEEDPTIEIIEYEVHSALSNPGSTEKVHLESLLDEEDEKKVRKVRGKEELHIGNGVTSKRLGIQYTLDNFVVGKDNRLAHAACMAAANMPGGIYNPLYIFSGVGLGKTHLLQSLGKEILNNDPSARVVYMTAEQFTNEIIDAIGKRRTKEFKNKYRNVDCFILDDIQFLENKDMSQMEFFHTFNDLYDQNKQIVLSSDSPPRDLDGFKERLRGRFGMGTVVEILPPDYETRFAILRQRAQDLQIIIDPAVLEFIAFHIETNVRDLIGVLMQTVSQSALNNMSPNVALVTEILEQQHKIHVIHSEQSAIGGRFESNIRTMQQIIDRVALYFSISKDELIGPDRKKEIKDARQVCIYLIRDELSQSYDKIGQTLGGRNHTTVLHAYNVIKTRLKTDFRLMRDINALKKEMGL